MDRQKITGIVEDYYRSFIPAMQMGGPEAALGVSQRFDERMEQAASQMEPLDGAAFRQALDAERERLLQEYQTDPVGLKKRLGVALGIDGPATPVKSRSKRGRNIIVGALVVIVAVLFLAQQSHDAERKRLEAAAACNGSVTADQLEAAADNAAANSGESVSEARESAIVLACPAMAR
jgi:hypothetical protein